MHSLEQKLNRLPKGKLSKKADLLIRMRLLRASFSATAPKPSFLPILKPIVAMTLIIILVMSAGTSAYAYGSDKVTRGHLLYGLKRAIEREEMKLSRTPMEAVKLHSKFTKRRLAEAAVLSRALETSVAGEAPAGTTTGTAVKDSAEEHLARTIVDADESAGRASRMSARISEPAAAKAALEMVAETRMDQEEALQRLAGTIGLSASDETVDDIVLELDAIKKEKRRLFQAIGDLNRGKKETEDTDVIGTTTPGQDETAATSTPESTSESLKNIESRIEAIKQELTKQQVPPKKIENFSRRLEKKLNKAKEAIDQGKWNQAEGLLRASEALTNNSEHFFREIRKEELKDDRGENRKGSNSGKGSGERRLELEIDERLPFIEKPRATTTGEEGERPNGTNGTSGQNGGSAVTPPTTRPEIKTDGGERESSSDRGSGDDEDREGRDGRNGDKDEGRD